MRTRLLFPVVTCSALALLGFGLHGVRAGSFFGPSCYGADYTYQYPNRSSSQLGCGPGMPCQARHPFFKHRLFHWRQAAPNSGMPPVNEMAGQGMPSYAMPMNSIPGYTMPNQLLPAPVVQAPMMTVPIHTTSIVPAPVPAIPAVQSRIVPVPAPLPLGPTGGEPSAVDLSGKPPF